MSDEDLSPLARSRYLTDRLLDQNERLIGLLSKAVEGSSAVEIIRALNPPLTASEKPVVGVDPYSDDEGHRQPVSDPWGDETVTLERIRTGQVSNGWVGPPDTTYDPTITPPVIVSSDGSDGSPTAA